MKKGEKYNRLTALHFIRKDKKGRQHWWFECECGVQKMIRQDSVQNGSTKSCGCLLKEIQHKMSSTIEYNSWRKMKNRCNSKNNDSYSRYGGRGIKVCKSWMKFENFYKDMGNRPRGKSLDRIDNNGDYEPNNCRWATPKQQMNNTRNNIFVSVNGVQIPFSELAEMFNQHPRNLQWRIFTKKLPLRMALTGKWNTRRKIWES